MFIELPHEDGFKEFTVTDVGCNEGSGFAVYLKEYPYEYYPDTEEECRKVVEFFFTSAKKVYSKKFGKNLDDDI